MHPSSVTLSAKVRRPMARILRMAKRTARDFRCLGRRLDPPPVARTASSRLCPTTCGAAVVLAHDSQPAQPAEGAEQRRADRDDAMAAARREVVAPLAYDA